MRATIKRKNESDRMRESGVRALQSGRWCSADFQEKGTAWNNKGMDYIRDLEVIVRAENNKGFNQEERWK